MMIKELNELTVPELKSLSKTLNVEYVINNGIITGTQKKEKKNECN